MTRAGAPSHYDSSLSEKKAGEDETVLRAKKRAEVVSSGGSCLSCHYTKQAVGTKLYCSLKRKYVSQYNFCEYWLTMNFTKKESKEER